MGTGLGRPTVCALGPFAGAVIAFSDELPLVHEVTDFTQEAHLANIFLFGPDF